MARWHIVEDRQLHRLARLRRLQAMLLLAAGAAAGLMLERGPGPVPAAQAAAPVAAAAPGWCEPSGAGLRMSCTLSAAPGTPH